MDVMKIEEEDLKKFWMTGNNQKKYKYVHKKPFQDGDETFPNVSLTYYFLINYHKIKEL